MKIFILEDDLYHQQRLERTIEEVVEEKKYTITEAIITSRPREIIDHIRTTGNHHLYLLDIDIKGTEKKGLEVAQKIRTIDPYGTIVFITTHSEFALLTYQYKVAALDFIAKDQEDATFKESVQAVLEYVAKNEYEKITDDALTLQNKDEQFQVALSDVLYFETTSQPHKVRLLTKNKRIEFYNTLSAIEKESPYFMKCHRSFVVNIANIFSIDKKEKVIRFENGEECFISRRKIKQISEAIEELT